MRYASAYSIPDYDDMGQNDNNRYMQINSVGYYEFDEIYGPTHRINGRNDYYLSYNHSGTMKILMQNKYHTIGPGKIFLYKPHEEQYYGQANKEPISNYWIHFTGYGVFEPLLVLDMSSSAIYDIGSSDEIVELFNKIIDEVADKKKGYEIFAASCLLQIFAIISRKMTILQENSPLDHVVMINTILRHIHENYSGGVSVEEMAKIACLSTSRFSCVFKQVTGKSPQQYLLDYRLDKAVELMQHTSLNIRQIAALTGYGDQLYFSRLFKKYRGVSPKNYLGIISSKLS
ncbi:MAG: AraC family transcriptional regulator [Saccharofermentanales bacterium]